MSSASARAASATPSTRSRSSTGSARSGRCSTKASSWKVGKVFFADRLSYQFDLLPESDLAMPAMINLQQYYLEEFLITACERRTNVELRWATSCCR